MTRRTYGGPLVDMAGAVDLHCHPYPDLFPRLADDFDIVRAARDAGMKAIVLKCHHENTVSARTWCSGSSRASACSGGSS